MSEILRLTLISHGITDAMTAVRFPEDEPLNGVGRRDLGKAAERDTDLGRPKIVLTAPELRARQTAQGLGLDAVADDSLSDLDVGPWRGTAMDSVAPEDLMAWLTDADSAPHGGESVTALVERVRRWMNSRRAEDGRITAVTHPAVVRAAIVVALNAPAQSLWRTDISPLSATTLHGRGGQWTLRSIRPL